MEKDLTIDVELARPRMAVVAEHTAKKVLLHIPPEVPPKDPPRPMTASTKRLSASTFASNKRRIKYATGKHAGLELVPQPSDDLDDPLNWPRWRKELNFVALLMTVGLMGGMKTAFISTNSLMALNYNVSYTAVAALTGVPLILSAFTGLASLIAARLFGKRPVYLISMTLTFIGAIWNMRAGDSYSQCMAARVFQGLGWGSFDTLLLDSIQDTFFEHERNLRVAIYNIFTVAMTWGPPLLGGVASRNANSFTLQFQVINAFQTVAIPLIIFGAPETNFNRAWNSLVQTPASSWSASNVSQPLRPRGTINKDSIKEYLAKMKPMSFEGRLELQTILQAPRAFAAPTTGLLVLVTLLPYCSLWSFAETLSQLFAPAPFMLSPASLGSLMAAPFVISLAVVAGFCLYQPFHKGYTPYTLLATLGAGTFLASSGILAFGLEISKMMGVDSNENNVAMSTFSPDIVGTSLSFPLVSILLGFVTAGVYTLDANSRPLIWRSTQFTSSSYGVCLRTASDMGAGVMCWRNLFAGIFIIAVPNAIHFWDGLKSTAIGLGVTQIGLTIALAAAWWFYDEHIRRMDGKVMGLVDLSVLKSSASFFDTD